MAEPIRPVPAPVPEPAEVVLTPADMAAARFTPRELRMIKEHFGRSFVEIQTDETSDERFIVNAWTKLRREGVGLTLDDMEDYVIVVRADQPENPTSGGSTPSSPPSAATGE